MAQPNHVNGINYWRFNFSLIGYFWNALGQSIVRPSVYIGTDLRRMPISVVFGILLLDCKLYSFRTKPFCTITTYRLPRWLAYYIKQPQNHFILSGLGSLYFWLYSHPHSNVINYFIHDHTDSRRCGWLVYFQCRQNATAHQTTAISAFSAKIICTHHGWFCTQLNVYRDISIYLGLHPIFKFKVFEKLGIYRKVAILIIFHVITLPIFDSFTIGIHHDRFKFS